VMDVSPAGYYAWRGRPESPRKAANRALLTEIRQVHTAHRGRYFLDDMFPDSLGKPLFGGRHSRAAGLY
jgi:hypothetical protein